MNGKRPLPFAVGVLQTEEDARRYVLRRLDSREWWCLPALSRNAVRVVEIIERRHFPGRRGRGFEVLVLREETAGVPALAFLAKRRLPAATLNTLLRELGAAASAPTAGGDGDVVGVLDPSADDDPSGRGYDPVGVLRAAAFVAWLGGGAA